MFIANKISNFRNFRNFTERQTSITFYSNVYRSLYGQTPMYEFHLIFAVKEIIVKLSALQDNHVSLTGPWALQGRHLRTHVQTGTWNTGPPVPLHLPRHHPCISWTLITEFLIIWSKVNESNIVPKEPLELRNFWIWESGGEVSLPAWAYALLGFLPSHCVTCTLAYIGQNQNKPHNRPHFPAHEETDKQSL